MDIGEGERGWTVCQWVFKARRREDGVRASRPDLEILWENNDSS